MKSFSLSILLPVWLTMHLVLAMTMAVLMKFTWSIFSPSLGLYDITYSAALGMYGFAVCLGVAFRSTARAEWKEKEE